MKMLEIERLRWKNFQSYGDYETEINHVSTLGPVLITGEIENGDSNGAGKSSIPTALFWCLTGRTFLKAKPGDAVANFNTTGECFVEITTSDGWVIKRTRRSDGDADLLVYDQKGEDVTRSTNEAAQKFINEKYGIDHNILTSSLFFGQMSKSFLESSDVVRREVLERLLGIDKISVWADVAKEMLEEIEKKQIASRSAQQAAESEIKRYNELSEETNINATEYEEKRSAKIVRLADTIKDLKTSINEYEEKGDEYKAMVETHAKVASIEKMKSEIIQKLNDATNSKTHTGKTIRNIEVTIENANKKLSNNKGYDLDAIRATIKENQEKGKRVAEIKNEITEIKVSRGSTATEIELINSEIDKLIISSNTLCPTCKQMIDEKHIADACVPLKSRLKELQEELADYDKSLANMKEEMDKIALSEVALSARECDNIEADIELLIETIKQKEEEKAREDQRINDLDAVIKLCSEKISKIDKALTKNSPSLTTIQLEKMRLENEQNKKNLIALEKSISEAQVEENPHAKIKAKLEKSKIEQERLLKETKQKLDEMSIMAAHYAYLKRSYADRGKVKKLVLGKLIPELNTRVKYYLENFGCDINIFFKDNLAIESDSWGYDFCSGGERKRIDLSIMFALHDLYLSVHGRQCNVMVLDEVDGRLDSDGIDALIKVINNDFTGVDENARSGAIFIISHRTEMEDAFPTKILVTRDKQRFSRVKEVT